MATALDTLCEGLLRFTGCMQTSAYRGRRPRKIILEWIVVIRRGEGRLAAFLTMRRTLD